MSEAPESLKELRQNHQIGKVIEVPSAKAKRCYPKNLEIQHGFAIFTKLQMSKMYRKLILTLRTCHRVAFKVKNPLVFKRYVLRI